MMRDFLACKKTEKFSEGAVLGEGPAKIVKDRVGNGTGEGQPEGWNAKYRTLPERVPNWGEKPPRSKSVRVSISVGHCRERTEFRATSSPAGRTSAAAKLAGPIVPIRVEFPAELPLEGISASARLYGISSLRVTQCKFPEASRTEPVANTEPNGWLAMAKALPGKRSETVRVPVPVICQVSQ